MTLQGLTGLCKCFIVQSVCVEADKAVWYVPCLVRHDKDFHQGADQTVFSFYTVRTPSVIKSLHGLRGIKHRLSFTPKQAVRTFNEVSGNTHRPIGGTSGAWKESLAQAALERAIIGPLGRGWNRASTLGEPMLFYTQ
jgi:hypothetical protein